MKFLSMAAILLSTSTTMSGEWTQTLETAKGQTVYFNAWGGDPRTNDFIEWLNEETQTRYEIDIQHVKLSDTAEAVNRVISEKASGNLDEGSVDMIWINGPNFLSMKEKELLHGPFVNELPNAKYLDLSEDSPATVDFATPVDGMEAPWRLAKLTFLIDEERDTQLPQELKEWTTWAAENPGKLTHPIVSDFMGATFLKQALIELVDDSNILLEPATDENFEEVTAPLWDWYQDLRPNLWREGTVFPANLSQQLQLFNDGEVDVALLFDPAAALGGIEDGSLPPQTTFHVPEQGTIGNISFVGIPFNAANQEAALVVANFMLEPEVQARMQNVEVLGAFSVLDLTKLDEEDKARFDALPGSDVLPSLDELGPTLLEPHASWMTKIAERWTQLTSGQ